MMSDFFDELCLRLACETPLPGSSGDCRVDRSTTKPYTRAQAKIDQQAATNQSTPAQTSTLNKKRGRKSDFDIFIDGDATSTSQPPSPKKLRQTGRIPLSVRTDLANDTPHPSPRKPDIPFHFSRADPLWANVQNYDPRPYYMTPPSTPGGSSNASSGSSPAPPPSPFSSPHLPTRTGRSRQSPAANGLPPPKDQTLYMVLKLDDWRASETRIKNAYRKLAVEYHPDKVPEGKKEDATHMMQSVNAAKEVLLDSKRRRAYHLSGKLPWSS